MNTRVILLSLLLFSITLMCSKKSNDAAANLLSLPFVLAPANADTSDDATTLEQMIQRAYAQQDSICERANKLHQQYELRQNSDRVRDLDP